MDLGWKKKVVRKAKVKPTHKRERSDALVFKTETDTYAEVLMAMWGGKKSLTTEP